MTKKHFEEMAKYCRRIVEDDRREEVIKAFIYIATEFNPRFDSQRFRAACIPIVDDFHNLNGRKVGKVLK